MDTSNLQGSFKTSVKSCHDWVGVADQKRVCIRWPPAACFIRLGRIRVRYEELTQSQWTAWITAIAAEEEKSSVPKNMLTYLAHLQDVCDFGFKSCVGSNALVVSSLEDKMLTWEDSPSIQKVRNNYSNRSQASAASNQIDCSVKQASFKARPQTSKRQVCRSYNSGQCTRESSHLTNDFTYDHHCSFFINSGHTLNHLEKLCT